MPAIVQSHRIWGTRYDSLIDATNSSPNNNNSNTTATNNIFHTQNRDNSASRISCFQNTPSATDIAPFPLHEGAAKERVHVQPVQYQQPTSDQLSNTTPTTERQYCPTHYSNSYSPSSAHSRMPHDASVFVASLPSHLSDSELQTLLTAHLGRHATVKHVKLIRDNRNAVCAFVQVQSAAQATKLIEKCNLSLFMDRQIRCEKARAFRTLLVSWVKEEESDHSVDFKIPSPQPLRLRRCRGSRFVQVTSGAEASCDDPTQLLNYSQPRTDDPLSGVGVFFESGLVRNDFESLKRLMEAFGPLEFMMPFDPKVHQSDGGTDLDPSMTGTATDVSGDDPETFQEQVHSSNELSSTIHSQESTDNEHEGICAVKWEHRNDAVSAVTALQSVPDLRVCWCHTFGRTASNSSTAGSGLTGGTGYSSNPSTPYQSQSMHRPTTTHRPRMLESETDQWHNNYGYQQKRYQYHNHTYPYSYNQNSGEGKFDATKSIAGHKSASLPLPFSETDFPPLNGNSNAEKGSSIHNETNGIPRFSPSISSTVDYNVDDRTPRKGDVRNRGVWNGERTFSRSNAPSPSPPSHPHSLPPPLSLSNKGIQNRPVTGDYTNTMSDQLDFFGGVIPHTPDTPDLEPEMGGAEENASGADMSPLTPGFPAAPHTPRSAYIPHVMLGPEKMKLQTEGLGKINGRIHTVDSGFDLRDSSLVPSRERCHGRVQPNSTNINNSSDKQHHHSKPTPRDRPNSYDQGRNSAGYVSGRPPSDSPGSPGSNIHSASDRELFVGGLKVESWSEERLREVFGQYGSIEELKFVKPGYNAPAYRRAFAFVKYVDGASAQRAIRGQHMCPYDDHMIKVQLRDTHPNNRRSQWNHRGRGRFNQANGYPVHEQDQAEGIRRNSPPSQTPTSQNNNQTSKKEDTLAESPVSKYPCVTDPLSQEEEAALQRDIDYDLGQARKGSDGGSLHTHSPDITVSSSSPLASPSIKSPQGPPRADTARRSTQSEPDVQSPPLVHNADVLSTYAPSSAESAPASSSYHSNTHFVPNPWMPSYSTCAPALHEYTQTGGSTVSPPQAVPHDGTFPWMGVYRNMMPVSQTQWFNPPPGVELTSAPLRPTGYIQGGNGIFIPVYPPERLGQYMSTATTSVRTENTEQKAQSPSSQTDTTVSPTVSNTSVGPTSRTSPIQTTATSTAPWSTMNSGTAHCAQPAYPSPMYPMPYIIPPHPMILSNPYSQNQWMSNPSHSVIYPPLTAHAQAYPHNQQVQSHQQQQPVASTTSMPVNGYPFYYQQTQVNYPRGAYPAYYTDNTNASQAHVQKSTPAVVVGGPQQQQQNSIGQNKYAGNGHRRDFSRPNSGKPIRKGGSFNNNGGGGSSPTGNGTGQSSHAKYFGGPIAKVISNTLPVQAKATASQ